MATGGIWIGIAIAVVAVILVLLPIEGYEEEKCIKEIDLIKLREKSPIKKSNNNTDSIFSIEEDTKKFYIQVRGNYTIYAYDNSGQYAINGVAYEEGIIKGNIKIYEDENCKCPVLKVFRQRPFRLIFAIAPFSTKTKYVFHLPTGTVDKW